MKNSSTSVTISAILVTCVSLAAGGCATGGASTKSASVSESKDPPSPSEPAALSAPQSASQPAPSGPTPATTPATSKVAKQRPPAADQPAPQPPADPKFEVDVPKEAYVDQQPPSRLAPPPQPESPQPESPRPDSPRPTPPPALVAPPLVKQPEAVAILERAREKLADVVTLDCVTLTEATGDAGGPGMVLGIRNRVQLRFHFKDAVSVPFFRIARVTETPGGEVRGPVAIYDGKRAIVVDDASRTVVDPGRNWFDVVGPNLGAIPQWFFRERMTLARRKPGATTTGGGVIEPEMIGARVLGVEQFDGQECDVVEFYYLKNIVKFNETGGAPEVVDEQRYTETIYFARADGLPRKVEMRDVPHPSAPPGSGGSVTSQYLRMTVNPGFEPAFFDTSVPAGYRQTDKP